MGTDLARHEDRRRDREHIRWGRDFRAGAVGHHPQARFEESRIRVHHGHAWHRSGVRRQPGTRVCRGAQLHRSGQAHAHLRRAHQGRDPQAVEESPRGQIRRRQDARPRQRRRGRRQGRRVLHVHRRVLRQREGQGQHGRGQGYPHQRRHPERQRQDALHHQRCDDRRVRREPGRHHEEPSRFRHARWRHGRRRHGDRQRRPSLCDGK